MGNREEPGLYLIEFDMMKKGTVLKRRGKPIKQFAVTLDAATRVITSGDTVDRATYDALVAAGAIEPVLDGGGSGDKPKTVPQVGDDFLPPDTSFEE